MDKAVETAASEPSVLMQVLNFGLMMGVALAVCMMILVVFAWFFAGTGR